MFALRTQPRRLFQPRRSALPFAEAVKRCLEDVDQRNRAPRAYHVHGRKFCDLWGSRDLSAVLPEDIAAYVARRQREVKPATVAHELGFLSRVFSHAAREGWAQFNPVSCVERPKVRNGRDRILSPDEEIRLSVVMEARDFDVVRLAVLTGMRRGELFGLRPQDVDLSTRFVHLPITKNGDPRDIPLNEEAVGIVRRMLERGGRWVVFPERKHARGRVAEWFYRGPFQRGLEAARIHGLKFHGLRHTFASRLVMAGVPLATVQKLMGHRDIKQTLRYAHLSPGYLVEAVRALR